MFSENRPLRLMVSCALALASGVASAQQGDSPTKETELEEIIVYGSQLRLPPPYAGGQVARGGRAGILGNMDQLETPFSSTNYTADLILNQQAKSVADVLLNDPNVRVARGFGNFQELFMIRGFPAYSDDMTYNGIYGILPRQYVAAEFMERVELFRGASAFLNGAAPGGSNLGGTINLVPKRAPDEPLTRLTAGYESDAAGFFGLDVGRRFGTDKATGVRGNAVYRDGETSVEDQDRKLTVLSFGVDHRGDRLRLAADVGYQDHKIDAPRPSVSPAFGATDVPDPPDASDNFAQRWSFTDEEQLFGVVRAEFDVTNTVAVWGAAGMRNGDEHNVLANPSAQANGTTSTYRFDNTREDDVYSGELGVRWDFETGPVEHRVIVSGSLYSLDSKNAYAFSNFAGFPGDLYDPVQVPPPAPDFFTGGDLDNPRTTEDTDTYSYAIADMLRFADGKFILTVGARHQNLKTETFDYNTHARASHYDESKVTPVGGIVYRPSESLSFFANYIEGLDAGGIAPTVTFDGLPVTNGGQALDPSQTQQFEAGVKYDAGNFGATLSLFNVESSFGILEPFDDPSTPTGDAIFRDDGEQRNRGVELSIFGQPFEHFRVIGGATFLDADMTKTEGGVNEGNTPIGAPQTQLNLNVEWDVAALAGLTLEARGMYTSSQYADGANTLVIDSWTRFDIGARYSTEVAGRPLALRARVDNVTDENDWISAGGYPGFGYFVLGAPRTFVLSASVDF